MEVGPYVAFWYKRAIVIVEDRRGGGKAKLGEAKGGVQEATHTRAHKRCKFSLVQIVL